MYVDKCRFKMHRQWRSASSRAFALHAFMIDHQDVEVDTYRRQCDHDNNPLHYLPMIVRYHSMGYMMVFAFSHLQVNPRVYYWHTNTAYCMSMLVAGCSYPYHMHPSSRLKKKIQ